MNFPKTMNALMQRNRLVIPNINKNDVIQGIGQLGKNAITWEQANSTDVPPTQKSKQS